MEHCKTCNKYTVYMCTGCTDTFYCSKKCRKANENCKNHTLKNIKDTLQLKANTASTNVKPCNEVSTKKIKEVKCSTQEKRDGGHCLESGGEKPCYKCSPIPGKGMGMIATRDIKNGELILEERPVLNITLGESLENQFIQLSNEVQKKVMSLYNAHPSFGELKGIMNSNKFAVDESNEGSVLCIESSRFNHSCLPNVLHRYSKPFERIFAIRDIKNGEELYTSYIQSEVMMKSTTERKKFLMLIWRFVCMCEFCATTDKVWQKEIERYRGRYQAIDNKITNSFVDLKERLAMVREMFEVMEKGEMMYPPLIARHAYDGFQLAVACKDRRKATKYVKQAYEANLISDGDYSPKTQRMLELMMNQKD